jgi:hypothetical protein
MTTARQSCCPGLAVRSDSRRACREPETKPRSDPCGLRAAERPASPAGAASVSDELPATGMAVPVKCIGWFGATRAAWGGEGLGGSTQTIAVQGFARLNVIRIYPDPLAALNAAGRPLAGSGALSHVVNVSPSRA